MGGVFSFSLREQFEACSDEALQMDSTLAEHQRGNSFSYGRGTTSYNCDGWCFSFS
jgi:hypothetical protein